MIVFPRMFLDPLDLSLITLLVVDVVLLKRQLYMICKSVWLMGVSSAVSVSLSPNRMLQKLFLIPCWLVWKSHNGSFFFFFSRKDRLVVNDIKAPFDSTLSVWFPTTERHEVCFWAAFLWEYCETWCGRELIFEPVAIGLWLSHHELL